MNNSNSCIGYNLAYFRYKFNCTFIEHNYNYIVNRMCRSILNDTDNANLNVLINLLNIRERNMTLEEFTDEEIMSMIKDIAVH